MMFRISILLTFCTLFANAQHKGFSYELQNEIGTFELVSLTITHNADNSEGVTYVIHKPSSDTVYQLDEYLNGWVGLSNDGRVIAHLLSEKLGKGLDQAEISFYRDGKLQKKSRLDRLIHYDLQDARLKNQLSKKRWLKNDSVLHKMASSPFYVTEDKLFVSFSKPKLSVFDLNQMFRIYTGNGANHFTQNYYSIPNAPYRTNFDWEEYVPEGFPQSINGKSVEELIQEILEKSTAIPEEAFFRVLVQIKLKADGNFELRTADVSKVKSNEKDAELSAHLNKELARIQFNTNLVPPNHPTWVFETNVWLK